MTVRIYGEQVHPVDCPVCTDGVVALSRVGTQDPGGMDDGRFLLGAQDPDGLPGTRSRRRSVASRLSEVIPCPQCTGASGLLQVLSPYGGAS